MPRVPLGPCLAICADFGTTTGLTVVGVKSAWLKGQGAPTYEGLRAAITFKLAYQVGREPRVISADGTKALKVSGSAELDEVMMPILAEGQPLMPGPGEDFDGPSRADLRFYGVLNGEGRGGDMNTVDAGEVLQVRQIAGLLDNHPDAALVFEDFVLLRLNSSREFLSSPRLRLAVEAEEILHGSGRVPFLQKPADAIGTVTDDRLRKAGLWFPGMEHARDAGRHAVMFFRECRRSEDLRTQAFPRHFAAQGWDEDSETL